jgi:hypothetical protein
MKCLYFLLIPFLFFSTNSRAQEDTTTDANEEVYEEDNTDLSYNAMNPFRFVDSPICFLGIYGSSMPFVRQQAFGGGIDFQIGYTSNCSVGLSLSFLGRRVDPKFGYNIGESQLTYYELNFYNEIKFLQWRRLSAAVRLNTGYAAFHLADNSIKEKYTWYDEYGNAYEGERALSIETNKFFKLAPVLYLRYKVTYHMAIEASAGYNWYIGNAQFGRNADFNNYMVQLGLKWDINW